MSTIYFIILFCFFVFISSFTAAFVIMLLGKLGIRDEIVTKAPKLISKLFDCDFCLSFWLSLILAIILAIFLNSFSVLFIPILSTPITRLLI